MITNQLVTGLRRIAATNLELPLIPLNNNKQPLGDGWQNRPFTVTKLIEAIEKGGVEVPIKGKSKKIQLQGFGILTGRPITVNDEIYYLMAVDQDGPSVIEKINELSGGQGLPKTVAFTSGRPGRCQYLFLVPEQFKDEIRTKKIKAGTSGDDGKPELLELRWNNLQSVLPPSVHPLTGQYHWVEGCAIDEIEMAIAPDWILELMLCDHETKLPLMSDATTIKNSSTPETEILPQHLEPIQGSSTDGLPRHPDQIKIPVAASVPLIECCRIQVRDWVNTGIPEGSGRNDAAINIGLELIAVERHLQCIGQTYSDSARSLFSEFCQRCGMTAKEDEDRWKWCESKDPSPSCGDEGIAACIKGWYWREVVKPQQCHELGDRVEFTPNTQHPTPNTFLKGNTASQENTAQQKRTQKNTEQQGQNSRQSPKNKIELLNSVKKILADLPQDSLRHLALMTLAGESGYPYRDIELLARIVERELNIDEETASAIAGLSTTLHLFQQRLDIKKYLESNFSALMIDAANAMPTAPEYLFNTLLPAVASRGGTSSRVVAKASGGYVQPLIFWTGNVAHSGQAKTPPQQMVINPLFDLEQASEEKYQLQKLEYEQDKSGEIALPIKKRYVLTNPTLPTKIRIHGENKRGLLEYSDELSSDYRRLNQYTKGVGDDKEQELSFFNGSHATYDRSDIRLFLRRTGISKTGSIQWDTLAELMKDPSFIESGYMARFLLCSIGDAPSRYLDLLNENYGVPRFQSALASLYEKMEQLPEQDYLLCHEAKVLFQAWNHTLIDATKQESNFNFSLVYAKIESYTLRIALWLHLVNALLLHEKPQPVIDGITMKHAIEIASFYLGQQKLIFAHNDPHNQLEGLLLKIHTGAKEFYQQTQKGVSASWAKQKFNALKKTDADKIRLRYFQVLAKNGYGQLLGEGKAMRYIPYQEKLVVNGISNNFNQSPFCEISKVGELSNINGISNNFNQSHFCELEKVSEVKKVSNFEKVSELEKVGEIEKVGEELVVAPTLQNQLEKVFQKKVGEIDGSTYSQIFLQLESDKYNSTSADFEEINHTDLVLPTSSQNEPIENHQFTNKSQSTLDEQQVTEIGELHQQEHQPPINNAEDLLELAASDLSQKTSELLEINSPNASFNDDIQWLLQLLDELENNGDQKTIDEWLPFISEAEVKTALCWFDLISICPDYSERFWSVLSELSQPTPQPPTPNPQQPTLEELKALLLACQTWVQLKSLKKQHGEPIKKAYDTLTPQEQLKIDSLEATAIPHDVYKYVGATIERNGQFLESGALVYIDPTKSNKSRRFVPVWLLHGDKQGWQLGLDVSRDCLQFVEKVVSEGLDAIEGHQGNLLDGLS